MRAAVPSSRVVHYKATPCGGGETTQAAGPSNIVERSDQGIECPRGHCGLPQLGRYWGDWANVDDAGTLQLGSLTVNRLGFGTMQLPGNGVWGPPKDRDQALSVLRRAVELGVDLLDTADSYGPNVAEELIHDALHPYPAGLKIATKAGLTRSGPDQWAPCGRPEYLRAQCESSLTRLGVDQIDLFQLHRVDPGVPADEQYGVLHALREEGKVREVGLSEVGVEEIEAAQRIVPIVSVQNQYNLGHRGGEDVVDYAEEHRIGFIPWFPLASGNLSRPDGPLEVVAQLLGVTASQVCLAWLLQRSPVMVPIPGTSSIEHLEENCAAAGITLTEPQYEELSGARKSLRRWALGA
jgi:pyridoxine 4-dehydrogenase